MWLPSGHSLLLIILIDDDIGAGPCGILRISRRGRRVLRHVRNLLGTGMAKTVTMLWLLICGVMVADLRGGAMLVLRVEGL